MGVKVEYARNHFGIKPALGKHCTSTKAGKKHRRSRKQPSVNIMELKLLLKLLQCKWAHKNCLGSKTTLKTFPKIALNRNGLSVVTMYLVAMEIIFLTQNIEAKIAR